jgi:PAS domain S-box-containing protein
MNLTASPLQAEHRGADTFPMTLRALTARGPTRGRPALILLSLAGLAITLGAEFVASNPQTVGPSMLLPWIALLAFEAGPAVGLGASVIALGLFLALAAQDGLAVTPTVVLGRGAAFLLIAFGVGFAGRKLHASERRSRQLVEKLPLAMYIEDDGGLTYVSPQIEPLLGYSAADWLAEPGLWRRSLHSEDRDRVLAAYSAAVAERAPLEYDYRLVGPDGRTVWVRDRSTCIEDGKRTYRQGFIVDVTQQKEGEAKLTRNAALMRGLIDGTVDGLALTDRDGNIAIVNRPLLRFAAELGIPAEGRIHERLLAIADSVVDRERFESRMRELAADPEAESFDEFEVRESERVFQGFTRAVIGSGDEYLGRVWTLREVTETRQVDRIKDALVANVSHELRTPLTSIIGYLELMGTGDERLGDEDARFLEIVRRNVARLQHMVEELLFVGRVDAEGLSLDREDVDVGELARNAIRSALPVAHASDLTLELEEDGVALVFVDPKRIAQVFDNLISNAIKFTPPGGNVKVSVSSDESAIVASVSDTGRGIPEPEQPRLFERFFRSSATSDLPGTGLGLTIVRAIVEGHGGSIVFESNEGRGTTFTFSLPLHSAAMPQTRRLPAKSLTGL